MRKWGEPMNRFRVFWFARTFSYFGDFIFSITMIWFALMQGGAWGVAGAISTSILMRAIGTFLLAPWVNYIGSRKMVVWADLLRGGVMLGFWAMALANTDSAFLTLLLIGVNSFLGGGFEAAMQAYIPTIATELRKANADLASGRSAVQLLGFLTGGALMEWFYGAGFLINSISFILAGIVSFYIGGGEPTLTVKAKSRSVSEMFLRFTENWQAARHAISTSPTLRLVFWTSLFINTFLGPMLTMMAPLVRDVIGGGSLILSIVQSAMVVGSLTGAMFMRRTSAKWKDGYMVVIGAMLCGAVGLIASMSHVAVMLICAMAVFGLGQAIYNIAESTVIQQSEAQLRASIYAIMQVVTLVMYPVASLGAAKLQSMFTLRVPFATGGLIVLLTTVLCGWRWMRMQLRASMAASQVDSSQQV
jgi:DHA3 family macrolide efflux protein-like MFS transporter